MLRHLKLKKKKDKLMSFRINDEKLLEIYKSIYTKTEDQQNTELNTLPIFDDRYVNTKIRILNILMVIAFILTFWGQTCQKMIENENILQSFLLIRYFYKKKDITCKYIQTIVLITLQTNEWQIILIIFLELIKIISYKCCLTIELI